MTKLKESEELEIFIPSNFDSKSILKKECFKNFLIDRYAQKLDYIVHTIYIHRVTNNKYRRDSFIIIPYKHFEEILSSRHTQLLKPLLFKYGIIEVFNPDIPEHLNFNKKVRYQVASVDNNFCGESQGYRLTKEFDVIHSRILVDKHTTLYRNIIKYRRKQLKKQDNVTQWINSNIKGLSIHYDDAVDYVENWFRNASLNPTTLNLSIKKTKHYKSLKTFQEQRSYLIYLLEGKRNKYLHAIHSLYNGNAFNSVRDQKGYRVHSPLTVLWKKLRQFVYLKSNAGLQLYSIDIDNSQPFCLLKIIFEAFPDQIYPVDVIKYQELVCSGKFYKHLIDKIQTPKANQKDFKISLFANVFYCENKKGFYTKEAILFRKEFPTVYQIIQQSKQSNHSSLSILMQRAESQAIIDGVMASLMNKYSDDYFISSIHDSIICPGKLIEEVNQLIIEHMVSIVGFTPSLKSPELFNKINI